MTMFMSKHAYDQALNFINFYWVYAHFSFLVIKNIGNLVWLKMVSSISV